MSRSARSRIGRGLVYLLFFGAAVHYLLPRLTTVEVASRVLADLEDYWLFAALAAQALSYFSSGRLICSIVELSDNTVTTRRSTLITLGSNTVGTLGGGVLGTATACFRWVRKGGVATDAATLSGWLPPTLKNCVLVGLSTWGLLVILLTHDLSLTMRIAVALLLVAAASTLIGIFWGLHHRERLSLAAERVMLTGNPSRVARGLAGKVSGALRGLVESTALLDERRWQKPLLWSSSSVGFDALTLALIFAAVGHPVSISLLLAGYALPQLMGKALFLPGGVGAVESAMVALYASLGVDHEIGVIVVLAYRIVSFWIPTLLGLIAAPYLEKFVTSRRPAAA